LSRKSAVSTPERSADAKIIYRDRSQQNAQVKAVIFYGGVATPERQKAPA